MSNRLTTPATLGMRDASADTHAAEGSESIFEEFRRYLALSEDMVMLSSKAALVKTARILAMQAAHYAAKYGEEPLLDLGRLLGADRPGGSRDSAIFLRDGARTFVGVLGVVAGGVDKDASEPVQ